MRVSHWLKRLRDEIEAGTIALWNGGGIRFPPLLLTGRPSRPPRFGEMVPAFAARPQQRWNHRQRLG